MPTQDQPLVPPFFQKNKALIIGGALALIGAVFLLRPADPKALKAAAEEEARAQIIPNDPADSITTKTSAAPKIYQYSRSSTGQLPIFTFSAGPLQLYQADNPGVAAAITASNQAMSAARTRSDSLSARFLAAPDVLAALGQRTGITATPDYSRPGSSIDEVLAKNKSKSTATSTGSTRVTIYLSENALEEVAVRDSVRKMVNDGRFAPGKAIVAISSIKNAPTNMSREASDWPIIVAQNSLGERLLYGISGLRVLSFSLSDGPD